MHDFEGFASEVGLLADGNVARLEALGFSKTDFESNGAFQVDKLPKLMEFCKQNPQYHIVTLCDEGYDNEVRSVNRQLYFLADGNKDPGLYVDACEACRGYEDCSCDEFASTVGLLKDDSKRLKALGFKKKDFDDNGCFGTNKLPKLMAFCVGHPEYHIVTQGYGGYCNRARTDDEADDDDPVGYYLADGSKDPKLCSHRYACSCADFQG